MVRLEAGLLGPKPRPWGHQHGSSSFYHTPRRLVLGTQEADPTPPSLLITIYVCTTVRDLATSATL